MPRLRSSCWPCLLRPCLNQNKYDAEYNAISNDAQTQYCRHIKYTEGGEKNLELARSYFAQAAKLNPNNMRAQYGLLLTASNLATGCSKSPKERQSNSKYVAWAAQQITDTYQTKLSPEQIQETKVMEHIEKILESLTSPN